MTTYLMHTWSGDVATEQEWREDFESMDVESWFGKPAEECEGLHWLNDQPNLAEVVKNEDGEWVEAA